jgi:hypothetical protein
MYRACLFCARTLARNREVEEFPVGRTIAFDPARGRLWAVCGRCGRWNLAPLAERWEAVEALEARFRDTRLRAHSENVGVGRLRDGTRLVRIGAVLPVELATWRYGDSLVRRHRRARWAAATILGYPGIVLMTATGPALVPAAAAVLGTASIGLVAGYLYKTFREEWTRTEPVLLSLEGADAPEGRPFPIRTAHLPNARLVAGAGDAIELHVPDIRVPRAYTLGVRRATGKTVVLADAAARQVLRRGLPHLNRTGAPAKQIEEVVREIERAGGASGLLSSVGGQYAIPELPPAWTGFGAGAVGTLALEMALHEEEERRVLQGEIFLWEAAWREAEAIASIADALPGPPPHGSA